jgi:prepilin-type N-terminal cleavage/methylation domain-containing protein
MQRGQYKQGFTLVELLIVMVMIGVVAGVSIVAYRGVQDKARQTEILADHADIEDKIESFTATDLYPASITDCPTPAATNLCITPRSGQTISYYAFNPTGAARFYAAQHSTTTPAYELLLKSAKGFFYSSTAEISNTNATNREFVQYMDMAPIIDQYGLRKYKISFDIKSASVATASSVNVYMQNGSGARYSFSVSVPVTTEYQRQTITVTPTGPNTSFTQSILAFYGTYGTGNIATIKNVEIQPG